MRAAGGRACSRGRVCCGRGLAVRPMESSPLMGRKDGPQRVPTASGWHARAAPSAAAAHESDAREFAGGGGGVGRGLGLTWTDSD